MGNEIIEPTLDIKYGSDKLDDYLKFYKPFVEAYKNQTINILELGVHRGGSCLFWRDYLDQAIVTGVDINISKEMAHQFKKEDRIYIFQGDQTDVEFLSRVAAEIAPTGYDIIIDDASHIGLKTKKSFWHLFDNHLKCGGYYFIEDWGTGYWDSYPDGRVFDLDTNHCDMESLESHTSGMVGFIKQLVDEVAASDVTRKNRLNLMQRQSKFQSMTIFPGIVVIHKCPRHHKENGTHK